jgi:hypothetical protein
MEISEITGFQSPGLTDVEHRKLLRQAADTGIIIFFKQFIPFFWFRYWNTRFRVGSVVWVFFILFLSAGASTLKFESMYECSRDSSGCDQLSGAYSSFDLALNTAAPIVFAIYSGHLARKARERLGIDRKAAIKLLSER